MLERPIKIVSKKTRQYSKGQSCTIREIGCEHTKTVVFAHLNSNYKGTGTKSPDLFGCDACYSCHQLLDKGKVSYKDQLRALQETQMRRYRAKILKLE